MPLLAIIIIGIIAVLVLTAQKKERLAPENIGQRGERKVADVLNRLPNEYHVINNVIIPDQGGKGTTQIDHVVVSPYGIFVIETKNYSGWIFGSEKSQNWKETFKTTQGRYFYNPVKQNWGHTYALAEHLGLNVGVFKPIVVFSDECRLDVESTTPVVHMAGLRKAILYYRQELIPQKSVTSICSRLSRINLVGKEMESSHVRSIGERLTERETAVQRGVCPRCGGKLVLRNGRYGQFLGCSNYPKCRFTENIGR